MSSIVLRASPADQAPSDHVSDPGGASSAIPASSCALSRIFAVALLIAAGVPSDGFVLKPWPVPKRSVSAGTTLTSSGGTLAAIESATEKIKDKAQLLAGMALEADPATLTWNNGAWTSGDQVKTIEDIALYAHGSGPLPPGVEGGLDAQAVYRD